MPPDNAYRPERRRALRADAPPASTGRMEVTPPELWRREPLLKSLAFWLWPALSGTQATALADARQDFAAALADIRAEDAADLLTRSRHARSLRELWHLRAELYSIVAQRHSQGTAESRLAHINRHFPQRAARTSQAALT